MPDIARDAQVMLFQRPKEACPSQQPSSVSNKSGTSTKLNVCQAIYEKTA